MAISPNVDFTSGQILTATQQNQFPRGIVARGQSTTPMYDQTSQVVIVTSSSFTAVAGRYYKLTFILPLLFKNTSGDVDIRIRKTNTSGTVYQAFRVLIPGASTDCKMVEVVTTLDAGSQVIVGTLQTGTGTVNSEPSATSPSQIIVEDVGLA